LYLQNQAQGQYYSTIGQVDDGGKSSYNGLLLSVQRRMSNNFSVLTNFTWSHCIGDPETTELTGPSYINPNSRQMDRGNCSSDRRRIFNLSFLANTPRFSNHVTNAILNGWQYSTILRYQSGNYGTVTAGSDLNLTGIGNQRPNATGADPILAQAVPGSQRFGVQYLNAASNAVPSGISKGAFSTTGLGLGGFGTLGVLNIVNPGMVQVDMKLARTFHVRERQTLEFRWEVFNVPNLVNLGAPNTVLSSGIFGQITSDINGSSSQAGDPRIMQMALKYVF
jgi:hypothetical protein